MGLHGMAGNVGIVPDVGIVKVGDALLVIAHHLVEGSGAVDPRGISVCRRHVISGWRKDTAVFACRYEEACCCRGEGGGEFVGCGGAVMQTFTRPCHFSRFARARALFYSMLEIYSSQKKENSYQRK